MRYITLLRGINVGGKNIISMATLQAIFSEMGLACVRTYIQSGNVLFTSTPEFASEGRTRICDALSEHGYINIESLLFNAEQFGQIVAKNPMPTVPPKALHYYFLAQPACLDTHKLDALALPSEAYCLVDQVLYLYAPEGIGRSRLARAVEPTLGVRVSARNGNTVNKLLQMLADRDK